MPRTLALLAALLALPLAGCQEDRTGCTRTAAAATGPGDARALFPAAVGHLWAYRVEEDAQAYRARVEVVGDVTVGGRAGVRLTDTPMGWPSPLAAAASVAVEPGGVTVLETDGPDVLASGLGALVGPHLLLRFPVTAGDTFTSYDCQGLVAGSVDEDARPDPVDARMVVTVVGEEAVTTPSGPVLAVRVDTRFDLVVHSSQAGVVAVSSEQQDWYAPGVGLVASSETLSSPGQPISQTSRALYAWSVGGATTGPVTRPLDLAAGLVAPGEVAADGWQVYRTTAPAEAPLLVGLFAQSGPVGLGGTGGAAETWWDCRQPPGLEAQRCLLPAGAGALALEVDAGALGPTAAYALLAAPLPAVAAPADESVTFARGEVVAGQVGTRGRSVYTATGLTAGVPVTVALLGGTGAADLRWAPGVPPDPFDTCWIEWSSVLPAAEQCTLTPAGDTATFAVEAGPLERSGATYLVAVW